MNIVTGEQGSANDPSQRNLAQNGAARAAPPDPRREEPPSTRQQPAREEPPSAREVPAREEPPRGESSKNVAADSARPGVIPMGSDTSADKPRTDNEQLAPLFAQNVASEYRERWIVVQQGFVDDPNQAVKQGDELLRQVMKNLEESFSKERAALEAQLGQSDKASTEMLRVALRRYRSFFERLLSI